MTRPHSIILLSLPYYDKWDLVPRWRICETHDQLLNRDSFELGHHHTSTLLNSIQGFHFPIFSKLQYNIWIDAFIYLVRTWYFTALWILNSCLTNLTVQIKSTLLCRNNFIKILLSKHSYYCKFVAIFWRKNQQK